MAEAIGLPEPLPNTLLREALKNNLGLPAHSHRRSFLRTLLHLCSGEPPPIDISVDDMALALLLIAFTGMKKRPVPQ